MASQRVKKHVLSNGLTVLLKPSSIIPSVTVQLWYHVGSKDEQPGEKGIAHFIEHMLFKGTKKLSECDINLITHKLSGYTNAFTSYDYTGYLFDMPSQQWQVCLDLLADCMHNASFKQSHLNSELKAVIQELKMYNDDYVISLAEDMIGMMFPDHPYHYPIIGYKQDLWSLDRDRMVSFYQKHYIPNNATLVVIGDFDENEALDKIMASFGALEPNFAYEKQEYYHGKDLQSKSVTLYRDVVVPTYLFAWQIPGLKSGMQYETDVMSFVVGAGKGSRLYKKLVDELDLVTEVSMFTDQLFDAGIMFIHVQPKEGVALETIEQVIYKELEELAKVGPTHKELTRAQKQTEMLYMSQLESNSKQAYILGQWYLATGDEDFFKTMLDTPRDDLALRVKDFVAHHLRPSLVQKGSVLPLPEQEKEHWLALQDLSDKEDERILHGKVRTDPIEEGCFVEQVHAQAPKKFTYPRAKVTVLDNGVRLLHHRTDHIGKIDLILDHQGDQTVDPAGKEGLSGVVAELLFEGTKDYTAQAFADAAESQGIVIATEPGHIKMSFLAEDLPRALELFEQMVVHATMDQQALNRVRERIQTSLKEFWDTPTAFSGQLVRDALYKGHPYSHNPLGTKEGLAAITVDDVKKFYRTYINPKVSRIAVVGDTSTYDVAHEFHNALQTWQGDALEPETFPPLIDPAKQVIQYPIMRDQTVLHYGALTVSRLDPDYDALLLFDQIFTGGVLGSMASRLFDLREQSGLFYTIGGSLIAYADLDKGMLSIKTIVSNDRMKEAEVAIEHLINTAADTIEDDEFEQAQHVLANSLVGKFATNSKIAATLLALDRFGFDADYFDTRALALSQISKEHVQKVVKKYLNTDRAILVRAGRKDAI